MLEQKKDIDKTHIIREQSSCNAGKGKYALNLKKIVQITFQNNNTDYI